MDALELELAVSPEEMCRTCLAAVDRAQLKPIFCNEILDGRIVPFPSVLELAVGEKFHKNDKLPNSVCVECKAKLRDLYVFVGTVRKSSKLLYEIFSVEVPKQATEKTIDTKCAEVQTDPVHEEVVKHHTPAQVEMIEIGTQCSENAPAPVDTVETGCQTYEQVDITDAASDEFDEKLCITPIEDESTPPEYKTLMLSEEGGAQAHEGDDVTGYEMILLADDPNGGECYDLRPLKAPKKRLMLEISTTPSKEERPDRTVTAKSSPEKPARKASSRAKGDQAICTYCNLTDRPDAIEKHLQIHRETLELCLESIDYLRCANCFAVFISQSLFTEHFATNCKRVSAEEYAYHPDQLKHETFYNNGPDICMPRLKTFNMVDNKYRCGRCTKFVSASLDKMQQHFHSHEKQDDNTEDVNVLWKNNQFDEIHVCGLCQAHFPDATYIRQHLYFHQDSFFCIYDCDMSFASFLRMTRHLQRIHMDSSDVDMAGKHQCKQCGKMLSSEASLKTHTKNHFRPRKNVCNVCNKSFSQKSDLTIHFRIHNNERPYGCHLCNKKFRTTSHRRDHMFTHESVNKFECDVCHKLFKAKRILAGHRRLHSGERPHQCDVCSKTFARKQHLKLHQKIHLKSLASSD